MKCHILANLRTEPEGNLCSMTLAVTFMYYEVL